MDQSGGLRMEIGVLYLSHAMLVLAELIVCSTRGFACILAKWFWPTEVSLSFLHTSSSLGFMPAAFLKRHHVHSTVNDLISARGAY